MMIGYARGCRQSWSGWTPPATSWGCRATTPFMNSTLGRVYGRSLDALINVDMMVNQLQEMTDRIKNGETATFNPEKWEPETWPSSCKGVGWVEAPRGSLSHWVRIENGQTVNYQAVVPSTWNSSGPRRGGADGAVRIFPGPYRKTPAGGPHPPGGTPAHRSQL